MNFSILRFDSLDSTNTEALRQAKLGADEGLCVIADRQTAGRGRLGRKWVSGDGSGLYFSVVLRPKLETAYLPLITLMAGLAVYDTLMEFGLKPDIKWVNDVLIGDNKISGILAETVDTPRGLAVVLGIGINLASANFSDEIGASATSIKEETGKSVSASEVAERLTGYISYFYEILGSESGREEILKQWQRRSSYFIGRPVRVTLHQGSVEGVTDGLEINGALRVKRSDGSVAIIQAGDVERLRRQI